MEDPKDQPTDEQKKADEAAAKAEATEREELKQMQEDAKKRRMEYLASIDESLPQKVEQWKAEYPRIESIHIAGQLYIYRGLRRDEYLSTMGAGLDKNKNDEKISSKCLLWPKVAETAWINMPAGVPMTLSDLILTSSGFGTEDAIPVRL
jgi:hypothetical protein